LIKYIETPSKIDESVIRSIVESKNPPHLLEPALDNLAIVPSKRSLKASMQIARVPMKKSPRG
jgi:hypothetical protein